MAAAAEYNKGLNHISSMKMNYSHYFLKQLTGYTIHPSIKSPDASPLRVADLGTQTAIWPLDVAEDPLLRKVRVEVDAFDIQSTFFPPAAWTPQNVRLHLHDIYNSFPENFHGQFDIVHLRLFLTLSKAQVALILQNVLMLLKPGGYVQWTEHDKTNITTTAATADQSVEAAQAFIDLQKMPFPNYDALWVNGIADVMVENGFEVAAVDRVKVRLSMLSQMNELHLISLMDVRPGISKAIDDYREKYLDTLTDEYRKGVSTIDGFICVVGRKPEN